MTHEDLTAFLEDKFPGCEEFDREAAIYWFAANYHGGQTSWLYAILSGSEFKPSPLHGDIWDEGEEAAEMYRALVMRLRLKDAC